MLPPRSGLMDAPPPLLTLSPPTPTSALSTLHSRAVVQDQRPHGSLHAWAQAPHLTREEATERRSLVQLILSQLAPADDVRHRPGMLWAPLVRGDLELANFEHLTSLPEGLCITGSLVMHRCYALRALPDLLQVGGHLRIGACPQLGSLPMGLQVPGELEVTACGALEELPLGLAVGQGLYVSACSNLTALPDDLRLSGGLTLINCPKLTALPDAVHILSDLAISLCPELQCLPPQLHCHNSCVISSCDKLTTLPAALVVGGHFNLSDCGGITALPHALEVWGDLTVQQCDALMALTGRLRLHGDVTLKDCRTLWGLPTSLYLAGSLTVQRCENFVHMPRFLMVDGDVQLMHCPALNALSPMVSIKGSFILQSCPAIEALPNHFEVGRTISLRSCYALTRLPDTLKVFATLDIYDCTALEALPDRLHVPGHLIVRFCTALTHLPCGLTVDGLLDLSHSRALTHLPADLTVGGDLALRDCRALTRIPDALLRWGLRRDGELRTIDLTGSGLDEDHARALRDARYFGLQFFFTPRPEPPCVPFLHLRQAANHYAGLGVTGVKRLMDVVQSEHRASDAPPLLGLCTFLCRLRTTADYLAPNARPQLLRRLDEALNAMSADPELRALGLYLWQAATESCQDRVSTGMDDFELALAVHRAKTAARPHTELWLLGLRFLKLEVVNDHAAHTFAQLIAGDEVEVRLAYHTALRARLDLPGTTSRMVFGSGVEPEELEAAAFDAEAQAADPDCVAAFFARWTPWQEHERSLMRSRSAHEALPAYPLAMDAEGIEAWCCPVTLVPLPELEEATGVLTPSGSLSAVYEHEALMKWWFAHGSDPSSRQPLPLTHLVRVERLHLR